MDKQIADQIIAEYLPKIFGFAVKKAYSYEEAEDLCAEIVQEAYLSLLRAENVINIEGYVWRISENTYAKYVSSQKKHEGLSLDEINVPVYDDHSLLEAADETAKLRRGIAYLTETRREIIYQFYYRDRSVSGISKAMGIPVGTVKWHLNKARNELKECFTMERRIGKLGISPITAESFGHSGNPGNNSAPEVYLSDKLNLNIVYACYHSPKTTAQIAEELGVTPVFIEDRIRVLEGNGFLVRTTKDRFTTYVKFSPETYSAELIDNKRKAQMEAAKVLVKEYVPLVRAAIADVKDVYIPGGNRELLEAAAIFYGVTNHCEIPLEKDLSRYYIKTTAGGDYIAMVDLKAECSDPDYVPQLQNSSYWTCGNMWRDSVKYPNVRSWSIDSRLCSRQGAWQNNLYTDYEYLYEYLNGMISDNAANADKFSRLRERKFLTEDSRVNIMIVKGKHDDFFGKIPSLSETIRDRFAKSALEYAMLEAKDYPPQMQDLVLSWGVSGFIGTIVAVMVMDILYADGTFRPLTENEKVTSNLIMFSDILP